MRAVGRGFVSAGWAGDDCGQTVVELQARQDVRTQLFNAVVSWRFGRLVWGSMEVIGCYCYLLFACVCVWDVVQTTAWSTTVPSVTSVAHVASALVAVVGSRPEEVSPATMAAAVSFVSNLTLLFPSSGLDVVSASTLLEVLGSMSTVAVGAAVRLTAGSQSSSRRALSAAAVQHAEAVLDDTRSAVHGIASSVLSDATVNEQPTVLSVGHASFHACGV